MSDINNLPDQFETFAQARKNGFLAAKEVKDSGKKMIGTFCCFTPSEIIIAAKAIPVGVCGVSEEPIPAAEKVLPRNLCPLIKSSYGHAITDTCPYFYFSDLLIGETTCDGKKKMYEELSKVKPMHVMQLPNRASGKYEFNLWKDEIILLKEVLEKELDIIANILCGEISYNREKAQNNEEINKHIPWIEKMLSENLSLNYLEAKELIKKEVGIIFSRVLEDAGVFKRNEKGQEGFNKFLNKAI